jgi:hypothetical protein
MSGTADYRYTYLGTTERGKTKSALVRIEGTVRGKIGAGKDLAGRVTGEAEVDLATGTVVSADVTVSADADTKTLRGSPLKVSGTSVGQLRRGDLIPAGPIATAPDPVASTVEPTPAPAGRPFDPAPTRPVPIPGRPFNPDPNPAKPKEPAAPLKTVGTTPEAKSVSGKLTGTAVTAGDLSATKYSIGSGSGPACLTWTADGTGFYHLDGTGTVRRISYPGFEKEAELVTDRPSQWLCLSAAGVLLTVGDVRTEAWVLDPKTLKVLQRIPLGSAKRAVSAPTLKYGYAAVEADFRNSEVHVLDLTAGKDVKTVSREELGGKGMIGFDHMLCTPDGKYLFATGGIEQVHRYKLDGESVTFEDSSPRLIQGAFSGLYVGASFVAAPAGGGNYGIGGTHKPYSTYVFDPKDVKLPVASLLSGAYPKVIAYDETAKLFYAQNRETPLIVFNENGVKKGEYAFAGGGSDSRQFLPHKDGRKLLVLGGEESGIGRPPGINPRPQLNRPGTKPPAKPPAKPAEAPKPADAGPVGPSVFAVELPNK